jgi:uncharacterized membrane protein HdeD (DUF308 family)
VQHRKTNEDWWLLLLLGLVSIGAGVIAIVQPSVTALVLVLLMAANALVTGVLDIVMAVRLRKVMRDEWMLVLSGAASIVFGIAVFLFPTAGALALVWLISLYAVVTGVLLLAVAFRVRKQAMPATARMGGQQDRRILGDRRVHP